MPRTLQKVLGGGGWMVLTPNLVFCFGPKLWFWPGLAQAEQNASSCFTPRLLRTPAMKHGFTDDTENEQAGGELTPQKAKMT